MTDKISYVYILQCADDTLYTGWTNDIEKRILKHNIGKGAKYTRSRLPVHLVYRELCQDKQAALSREAAIKRLSRQNKIKLILQGDFSCSFHLQEGAVPNVF